MDKHIYLINLFDYYENLFTEKQRQYFKDYYFNNLTLSEISENDNISRSAIHKQIKTIEKKLNDYEKKLGLYEKSLKIKKIIKNINPKIKKLIEELI